MDPAVVSDVAPGDIEAMATRLVSSPAFVHYRPRTLSQSPPFVQLDAFLSPEEADELVAIAERDGGAFFGPSATSHSTSVIAHTVSAERTSSTQWCVGACANSSVVRAIAQRVEAMTGVPQTNGEALQLLRYRAGQGYQLHHDYIALQRGLPCGVRVWTVFLYLSDVEEGGFTSFPRLGISVKPKKGRAVIWPSTLSEDPEAMDIRTMHAAEPVVRGVKYAANLWLHSLDFMAARERACIGALAPPPAPSDRDGSRSNNI